MALFFERKWKMRDDDEAFGINIKNRVLYILRSVALILFFVLAVVFFFTLIDMFERYASEISNMLKLAK